MQGHGHGGTPHRGALAAAVVGTTALLVLAGCGRDEATEPQADATHEVCVGEGAREGAWTVEAVQDDRVVASLSSDGAGSTSGEGDGAVELALSVAPDVVTTVRFDDGEVIGETALAPGGVAEWVVGEGCP